MLPITFFRSSLINNLSFCEHQSFLTYCLGLYNKTNVKAEVGTATHKILESLAIAKKGLQTSTEFHLKDDLADVDIIITMDSLLQPKILSQLEIDKINSTRLNKDTYKWDVFVPTGHIRFGVELVEYLIDKYGKYYAKNSANTWEPAHFKQLTNFVWIALDYQNGAFDPRRAKIFGTETFFDLTIDAEWAKYNYDYRGKQLNGILHLKGTIDLIVELDENTLELRDYKSGQRLDWNTGEPKTYKKLHDDNQLLTYYWAGKKLYPDKNLIISIFFIRDGGPYSICFHEEDILRAEQLFKNTITKTKNCELPILLDPLQKNFKCNRICDYYKQKIGNTNMCMFIHNEIQKHGLDYVVDKYTKEGFTVGTYDSPGEA